jgi:hypothetical protein
MSHFNESSQLYAGGSPGCLMQRLKARVLTHFRRAFEKCDIIMMPATPDTAGQVPAAVGTGGTLMMLLQQVDSWCRLTAGTGTTGTLPCPLFSFVPNDHASTCLSLCIAQPPGSHPAALSSHPPDQWACGVACWYHLLGCLLV